jgi:acetoin utilization protein AcuC
MQPADWSSLMMRPCCSATKNCSEGGPVFISHPVFHQAGYGGLHPLAIARIGPVTDLCRLMGWLTDENYAESHPATADDLVKFHDPGYLSVLQNVSATGRASFEERQKYHLGTAENPVFPNLFNRVAISVGGSILAARYALQGRLAYHPAGGTHHGMRDRAHGFCFSNDPYFAIRELLDGGLNRVAYVDLDAHHGDGVEAAFENSQSVLCISVHEKDRWPGTGRQHTRTARNFPVQPHFSDAAFQQLLHGNILPILQDFAADGVVVTCGADALAGDPLSTMKLSNTTLWDAVLAIRDTAGRAVVLGGGGYNPWTTIRYWSGLWARLNNFHIPDSLPTDAQDILRACQCDLVDDEDVAPHWFTTIADPGFQPANGVQ